MYIIKIECKRVRNDADGCEWVRMGALGHRRHREHINKVSSGHLGSQRSGIGSYGRGNFPGHHVLGSLAKSDINGCRWIYAGSDGCVWMHGHGGT